MLEYLLSHYALVRLAAFLLLCTSIGLAEQFTPRRTSAIRSRWFTNLALLGIDTLIPRLINATSLVGIAMVARRHSLGILPHLGLNDSAQIVLFIVAMDLALYWQHRILHIVPILWRVHSVHHADNEFDLTTGVRFHPLEAMFSLAFKAIMVILCGAPVVATLFFEVLLNAASLFNHSNIRLATILDRALRSFVVTPDMHRIHHSAHSAERERNFGFFTSVWDRLFGTYQAEPRLPHAFMPLGLKQASGSAQNSGLWAQLCVPFWPAAEN